MNWDTFHQIVRSRAIGEPVFFRCLATCTPAEAEQALAALARTAAALVAAPPETLRACGSLDDGSLVVTLFFRSGATALLQAGPGNREIDVMFLGNQGAAYLERQPIEEWASLIDGDSYAPLIRESLARGATVAIEEEAHG